MNEKPINPEKTTYSVLNVLLLIYEQYKENSDWRQTTVISTKNWFHMFSIITSFLKSYRKDKTVLFYKM